MSTCCYSILRTLYYVTGTWQSTWFILANTQCRKKLCKILVPFFPLSASSARCISHLCKEQYLPTVTLAMLPVLVMETCMLLQVLFSLSPKACLWLKLLLSKRRAEWNSSKVLWFEGCLGTTLSGLAVPCCILAALILKRACRIQPAVM